VGAEVDVALLVRGRDGDEEDVGDAGLGPAGVFLVPDSTTRPLLINLATTFVTSGLLIESFLAMSSLEMPGLSRISLSIVASSSVSKTAPPLVITH
jgi:hypothetical protein